MQPDCSSSAVVNAANPTIKTSYSGETYHDGKHGGGFYPDPFFKFMPQSSSRSRVLEKFDGVSRGGEFSGYAARTPVCASKKLTILILDPAKNTLY